ncbi:hypothetical protein Nepgr_020446 [Nepenthes gracilis]|uniref:Uncharacterized protein n=1 Tax=Nepenthes gracilis TaxID=150966 RepID=A0AAD3SVC5_NEPGR|nr:hypothetical protein Nepgr_020446 [Nepenthes gracilis]
MLDTEDSCSWLVIWLVMLLLTITAKMPPLWFGYSKVSAAGFIYDIMRSWVGFLLHVAVEGADDVLGLSLFVELIEFHVQIHGPLDSASMKTMVFTDLHPYSPLLR